MEPLTVERIFVKIHTVQNENASYALKQPRGEKEITTERLRLIEPMRNINVLPDYVHMTTYNQINEKIMCVPIIDFYILLQFNIRRHFIISLSVMVYDSCQTIKPTIKYCTKIIYQNLHNNTPECCARHHKILNKSYDSTYKVIFVLACHLH